MSKFHIAANCTCKFLTLLNVKNSGPCSTNSHVWLQAAGGVPLALAPLDLTYLSSQSLLTPQQEEPVLARMSMFRQCARLQ